MKKFFTLLCVAILLFSVPCAAVAAVDTNYSDEQIIAEEVMSAFGSYTIEKCVELYDAGGEVEAVCFNFFPKGYVIVNVNDFSIPEFSPEAVTPFPNELGDGYYVYVGPLSYYSNDGVGTLTNLRTGKTGTVEQLNYVYDIHPDNDARTATGNVARASVTRASLSFMTKHQPVTWTSPATLYKCGLDSCAIELKYLHDYHDSNLLTYFTNANYALQKHLLDGKYIPNTGTYACDIVDGIGDYTGINAFFKDRKSTIRAYYKAYSNSVMEEMEESFEDDYPVIIGTEPADDWDFAEHWIIAYGYYYQDLSGSHWIINDAFGNSNIFVTTAVDHYDDVIFFS